MAVTKTHPIKSTLKAAIDYILNPEKTDGKLLASSFGCGLETADIEFAWTREAAGDRGTHLGRHLIQSFAVGETTPEEAHKIGMELAGAVLGGKYEFVLTTHVDKDHLHNHLIFNSVSFVDYNYYNCMGNIKRNEEAEQILKTTLEVLLSENQGYCSESMLYVATKDKLRDYFDENNVCNAQNLFYLAYMLFDGEFSFRRPHIASVGRFKSLNVKDILIDLLGSPTRLYYDAFMELTTNLMIPVVTAGMVFTEMEKEYIRISQNEYLRKSCVSFDTSDIEIIKGLVESYTVDEWYLPLQKFAECEERLPNRVEINEFVMESLANELDLGWHVVQPRIKDRRYQKGIMVRNDNSIMTYDALVASVLLSKGISELSEAQLLSFMQISERL